MRSVVVLPQPDGPSSEKNSPAAMSSVTPSTASTRPSKVLVTSSSLMVARSSRTCHPEAEPRDLPDRKVLAALGMTVPFRIFVTRASMSSLRALYHFQSGWISVATLASVVAAWRRTWRRASPSCWRANTTRPRPAASARRAAACSRYSRRPAPCTFEPGVTFSTCSSASTPSDGAGEIDRLVLAVIAIDAGIVDDAHRDLARQQHLFHLAGEVDQLDRLQLLQRLVGGIEVVRPLP